MRTVKVDLGDKSYDIIIGHNLKQQIIDFVQSRKFSRKALLITDTNIEPLYGAKIQSVLNEA